MILDKKRLLVLGAGDYGKILGLYLLDDDSKYNIVAYVDELNSGKSLLNKPIIKIEDINRIEYDCIAIAASVQETHKIIKKVIKQIPELFKYIIENPI